jgi:hypothetical protein
MKFSLLRAALKRKQAEQGLDSDQPPQYLQTPTRPSTLRFASLANTTNGEHFHSGASSTFEAFSR